MPYTEIRGPDLLLPERGPQGSVTPEAIAARDAAIAAAADADADRIAAETARTDAYNALQDRLEMPINAFVPNGYFRDWLTRPASGKILSPGGGAGILPPNGPDGWYGGPGPASQYEWSREIDDAALGTYALKIAWQAPVSAGEPQNELSGDITSGYHRFTFLESIGHFAPGYLAGKTLTLEFDIKASSVLSVIPIGWASMGNPGRTASTAYYVGDIASSDFGNGEGGSGRLYLCTAAGTSTAGAGPAGTGSLITDGTVTWSYLGEIKGREFELYEASASGTTMRIAHGDPTSSDAVVTTSTSWQSVLKKIFMPALNAGSGTRYNSRANDNGVRTLTPPRGAGAYSGMGFDLYFTGSTGPAIWLRRIRGYIGTRAPVGPVNYPRDLETLVAQGFGNMLALYGVKAATKAEVEAASAYRSVSPAVQHYHASALKAHVSWDTTGTTLKASYNVASVINTAVGKETVVFSKAMATGNYTAIGTANTANSADATESRQVSTGLKNVGSIDIYVTRGADPEVYADATDCNLIVAGTLAA